MTNLRQAAQQAIDAIGTIRKLINMHGEFWLVDALKCHEAADALRKALAEPQTTHWEGCEAVHPECRKQEPDGISWLKRDSGYFTAPTPRKPLTDEEIDRVTDQQWAQNNHKPIYAAHRAYARAIERAHGIGEQHE